MDSRSQPLLPGVRLDILYSPLLAEQVLAIPFNLFDVFRLERRYGFSTTTARLWLLDLVKEVVISSVILSFLTCAGLWLISRQPGLLVALVLGCYVFVHHRHNVYIALRDRASFQ